MRRLNICYVGTPWLAVGARRGGIQKTVLELSRVISRDHDVHVVCPTPRSEESSHVGSGIQFHFAPVGEVRRYPIRNEMDLTPGGFALGVRFIFAVVVLAAACLALHRKHTFDVTYFCNKYVAAPILLMLRRRRRGAFVYSERNTWPWLYPEPAGGWAWLRYWANVFLGKLVCQMSDAVHVNSESLRDAMTRKGINGKFVVAIPNGVDVPQEPITPTPLSTPIRVGFVGRLVEVKGVRILVEVMRRLNEKQPDVEFDLFGDGPMRSLLLTVPLRNCSLWGEKPRDEVLNALRSIHIILFLSPIENIPSNALMEALALGKAVIATAVGDTSRFLSDRNNAVLCSPDPEGVANAISVLCTTPALYYRVAAGGQALAASFSWKVIAARHLALYTSALSAVAT